MSLFGLDNYFYHSSIRRYVSLFGSLFTDIYIKRAVDGREDTIQVPIRYGKGNMYSKAPQDSQSRDGTKHARVLPAIAFTLESFYKDVHRKTNAMNRIQTKTVTTDNMKSFQFNRVPYNFMFNLKIATKNTDDMLQIVEQVIPAFDGNLSVTIEDTTGISVEQDIIISLQEIEMEDNYDDEMKSRFIEWTLTFELRGFLYKKTQSDFVIKEVDIMRGFDMTDIILPTADESQTQNVMTETSLVFNSLPTTPIKKVTRKSRK